MDTKEKQIGKYVITNNILGKGAYAVCKKGYIDYDCNQSIAVKIIDKKKLQMQND